MGLYREWVETTEAGNVRRALIVEERNDYAYAALVTFCADSALGRVYNHSGRYIEVYRDRIELRKKRIGCFGDGSELVKEINYDDKLKERILNIQTKEEFEALWKELTK